MNGLEQVYQVSLGLLTDLYQISMAYAYWRSKTHEQEAVFNLSFRQNPFQGGYAVACGLEQVIQYVENFRFSEEDICYLATLKGSDEKELFSEEFLIYLKCLKLTVQIDAIEEGRLVFAQEPLLRVQGPLLECQLLETALLNLVNFQTLIATKAARVKMAAGQDRVIEFGLRRAQGIDGGLTAARAAFIGGSDATSNLLAGKIFGIPVTGTHAHSWVMSFKNEQEAFKEYSLAMPNNAVFLVDTYHTLDGVKYAIQAGKWLVSQGHKFMGIRLDSGDLTFLSIEARRMLDEAGFTKAEIIGSNDLDEHLIEDLKRQGAKIDIWGVGTKLTTAYDQPALGGVYKLVATRRGKGKPWVPKIKLSEQVTKITTPGIQQVRRFSNNGHILYDMIYDVEEPPEMANLVMIDPLDPTRQRKIPSSTAYEDLLVPVVRNGQRVYDARKLTEIRDRGIQERFTLHSTIRRFLNPHIYPVGLEQRLYKKRAKMILEYRGFQSLKL